MSKRKGKYVRKETTRADVEWIDGVPYCQTCSVAVGVDDVCSPDCVQGELGLVLKHIRGMQEKSGHGAGSFVDETYDEILAELTVGAHR